MEGSVMQGRAERFLEKLEALDQIAAGWEHEIGEGIRLLGAEASFLSRAACVGEALAGLTADVLEHVKISAAKARAKI